MPDNHTSRYGRVRSPSFKVKAMALQHYDEECYVYWPKDVYYFLENYAGYFNIRPTLDTYFGPTPDFISNDTMPEFQWVCYKAVVA